MPILTRLTWTEHRNRWSKCQACELCRGRTSVVLARGSLPCDVLFIGEAPGASEDVLGIPFAGPAGQLLDRMISDARRVARQNQSLTVAFTNLVACIPLGDDHRKVQEPSAKEIAACRPRLEELVRLANPKALAAVGQLAGKHLNSVWPLDAPQAVVTHPAFILRAGIEQRGLAIQQVIVLLADLFETIS